MSEEGDGLVGDKLNREKLKKVAEALDELAEAIRAGSSEPRTLSETVGWNCPPINVRDLARLVEERAERVRLVRPSDLNPKFDDDALVERVESYQSVTLPYMFNGNAAGAVPPLMFLLDYLDYRFSGLFEVKIDWEKLENNGSVPKKLAAKVRSLNAALNAISAKAGKLDEQVEVINSAHAAAEALPTDMESLEEARQRIADLEAETARLRQTVENQANEVAAVLARVQASDKEAAQLVVNCGDAYSAATTKGLGEAFQNRADSLSHSVWIWVGGLVAALGIGAFLGIRRVEMLQTLIAKGSPTGNIGLYLGLAFFSIAAPVWFAWIATKQIGQRFRLAEDYGFKASVAKAYEGYRREAAKLDEGFAARLFGTALDRIDEAPLRFVEAENHGSPLHEMFNRAKFRPAADEKPKERVSETPELIAEPLKAPQGTPEEDE